MAKKQTRRTISISKALYARAMAFAVERDTSLSNITENLLRREVGMPEVQPYQRPHRAEVATPLPLPVEVDREWDPASSDMPEHSPAELKEMKRLNTIARRRLDNAAEERAFANPCRLQRCPHGRGLHEAHDD